MIFTPDKFQQRADVFLNDGPDRALFMGMGVGKTATVLHSDFARTGALVMAPRRVITLTWPNEIAKWGLDAWAFPVYDLRQDITWLTRGQRGVYLINWDRIPQLCEALSHIPVSRWPFDTVVFDELTRAKGSDSKTIAQMRLFAARFRRRWGLTGTPRPNSHLELWGQYRLLDGGRRLGPSFDQFKHTYFIPKGYKQYQWEPLPTTHGRIMDRVQDMTLSITRREVFGKPDAEMEDLEVDLPPQAIPPYKRMERELIATFDRGEVSAVNSGVLAGKLLQIAGGQVYEGKLEDDTRHVVHVHEAKMDRLKLFLQANPQPVIVVYNYIHEKNRLRHLGDMVFFDEEDEKKLENLWNAGQVRRLAIHPKSAGHGLNLQHGGHTIIWFSTPWSRELYDQVNCRLDRREQLHRVRLYRLIARGTIDEAIAETLRERGQAQNELLETLRNYKKLIQSSHELSAA